MERNILIIAGEPSGDMRGAELLRELKPLLPETSFWGIGGDLLQKEGVDLIEHLKNFSIFGIWEAVKSLKKIRTQIKYCKQAITKRKPYAAILIDYPGFNFKIAKFLHEQNIPVMYYIIPQVWAWGEWRTKGLKTYMDKLFVLFEFEKKFLAERGIEAEFIGHPLVDSFDRDELPEVSGDTCNIALLPGSRKSEVEMVLPDMLDSARMITQRSGRAYKFVLAENSNVNKEMYEKMLDTYADLDIQRVRDDTYTALALSSAAIVTSGTATLEAAFMLKPFLLVYKSSYLTAILAKLFVKLDYIGLANLVAGKQIIQEKLQMFANPREISTEIIKIVEDEKYRETMIEELRKVKQTMGRPGCAKQAAASIAEYLNSK